MLTESLTLQLWEELVLLETCTYAKVKKGIVLTLEDSASLELDGVKMELMPVWKWILESKS